MLSFVPVNFNNWYRILYDKFFKQLDFDLHYVNDIVPDPPYYYISDLNTSHQNSKNSVWFFDQEPLHPEALRFVDSASKWYFSSGAKLLVTSEISETVDRYAQGMNATSIYYFFHAIAANEWYRNYRWDYPKYTGHKHTFISYNNLVSPFRAHRIDLLCRLYDKDLVKQGLVSFNAPGDVQLEKAIERNPWYTEESKFIFDKQKSNLSESLTIDTEKVEGFLSASIDLKNSRDCLVQVVTETEFFKDKLHLTEKVFKPIVSGQPFLLLAGVGNLGYLKRYGFKTFGDYWDESYDDISDPGERVKAVVDIIEKLAGMSYAEQVSMRKDMQGLIEHNFDHLFTELRPMVVSELLNNTTKALDLHNIKYNETDLRTIYKLLVN